MHYMMNPDPYRGPFGNDGAAYAAQVTTSGPQQRLATTALFESSCTHLRRLMPIMPLLYLRPC